MTFDFWNTLVRQDTEILRDTRANAWLGLLDGAGFAIERAALDAAMESAWEAYVASWKANEQFTAVRTAEHCLDHLGLTVPDDLRDGLVLATVEAGARASLRLTDNVADTIVVLKTAGLRIGIICDVGFTPSVALRAHLERFGLLDHFDHWSFSDEVGVYKPSAQIFDHALAGLGVDDASRAAHVGDLRRTDVGGAKARGLLSIRYTGVFDDDSDGPEADHVVADHAEIPAILGVDA